MAYRNRIRLPITFGQPQFPTERNVFRLANGTSKVQSVVIRNTYDGKTDQLPEAWHRKLVIALSHDDVSIENERLLSNVVLSGDYTINWQDFLNYPIAQSLFKVEVTPFDATNSNCQTCDEMTQLSLVDDHTDEIWDEGTTHVYPDVLTDNDSICCRPYTIELVTYNPLYFQDVTISADGVLTATVRDPSPLLDDIFLATYRVTCPNGSWDEADVYANTTGSVINFCYPALIPSVIYISSTEVDISWEILIGHVPANPWIWNLYLSSDLGTSIQNGTVAAASGLIHLTGLTPGVAYTVVIVSDCGGGNYSSPTSVPFEITEFASQTCANFTVTYLPVVDDAPQSISYMNCVGDIVNFDLTFAQETDFCMLIVSGAETPVYFVASSVDISINYVGLCE